MQTVKIDNVDFKHGLSASALADAIARIQTARIVNIALEKLLRESVKQGDKAGEEQAVQLLLSSPESLLCSAITANKKLKPAERQSLDRCLAVPSSLTFAKPLNERVPVYPKSKKAGGVRMIHKPRLLHRTGQDVVARIMSAYLVPWPFQYTFRGVPAAISRIKKLVNAGYIYVARLDIKDFYASFDPDLLAKELPLPYEVVDYVVTGRHLKVVWDQERNRTWNSYSPHIEDLLSRARLGIPPGSGCSPIIGAYCMSRLVLPQMKAVPSNFVDDFLLLAESEGRLKKAIGGLISAVAILPGGHFDLRLKHEGKVTAGFEFLGHHLRRRDGGLVTSPTQSNLEDIHRRLYELDTRIGKLICPPGVINPAKVNIEAALGHLSHMVALAEGWLGAFRECDDLDKLRIALMLPIECWREQFGVSWEQLKSGIEPSMYYEPSDYAFGH